MACWLAFAMLRYANVVLPVFLFLGGCSTTLSTLQPAEPMKPGHVQVNVASNINIPATRIRDAIDVVDEFAERYARDSSYVPSQDDRRRAIAAGVGLGLNAPGVTPDIMARIGVVPDLDVGLRWSGVAAHVDGKYRFFGDEDTWQGSVSLGASKTLYNGFVFEALDYLNIGNYSRYNVELPIIFGRRFGNIAHIWFGPKYVYSYYELDASLRNVGVIPSTSGSIHHLGVFGGAAVGYKYVFFIAELTAMKMFAEPEIMGTKTDLGGIVIVPSFGIMLRL